MGDQNVDVAPLFQGIALHLTGTIKSEGAAAVPNFSGEAKRHKEWIQRVEPLTEVKKLLKLL